MQVHVSPEPRRVLQYVSDFESRVVVQTGCVAAVSLIEFIQHQFIIVIRKL